MRLKDLSEPLRGTIWLLFAVGASHLLAYAYQFVVARALSPTEYARFLLLFSLLAVLGFAAQVVQPLAAKVAAECRTWGEQTALGVFAQYWLRRLTWWGTLAGVTAAAMLLLVGREATPSLLSIAVFVAAASAIGPVVLGFGLLQGLGRHGSLGILLLLQGGVRITVGSVLLVFGGSLDGAFVGASAALIASAAAAWLMLRGALWSESRPAGTLRAHRGRLFGLGALLLLANGVLSAQDAVLVPLLLSPEEAGSYAGAVAITKVIRLTGLAVGYVLLERTARAYAAGDPGRKILFASIAFCVITSLPIVVGLWVAGEPVIQILLGARYLPAATILGPYSIGVLAQSVLSLWVLYFVARERVRIGIVVIVAVAAEFVLLVLLARDAQTATAVVVTTAVLACFLAGALFLDDYRRVPPTT